MIAPGPPSDLADPSGQDTTAREGRALRIAYLVNQYPQPSQTFIRREIAALERQGLAIQRYTVRSWPGTLVDPDDAAEKQRTRVVLGVGLMGLCAALLRTAVFRPARFLAAARQAVRLGRWSQRGVLCHITYLAEACVLLRWWSEAKIDHVHVHFGTNATAVALLCRTLGGPRYSFTVHGPEEFDQPLGLQLGEKMAASAFTIAISQFGRSQLCRWASYEHWHKLHVVRCGLDAAFLERAPSEPPAARRLVCVARLEEAKGTPLLIEAVAQLAQQGLPFTLTLIGDGRLRGQIEAMIERFHLQDVVHLAGWKNNAEVRQELLASRALVLPSFAEGLPVAIMESLALHRPVISTYVGGIAELVQPARSGWLIPPADLASLVTAMREALLVPRESLAVMGSVGAEAVSRLHNVNLEAARLKQLFLESAGVWTSSAPFGDESLVPPAMPLEVAPSAS